MSQKLYKIVRYYRKSAKRKVIFKNQTLAMAQAHCNREDTKKEGVWFDGYTEQ